MKRVVLCVLFMVALSLCCFAAGTDEKAVEPMKEGGEVVADKWWPFPVNDSKDGKVEQFQYEPLEGKASKKYNIVALIPHMKDKTWLACNYGLIKEAERQGVKLTILQAGGYENLSVQLSQYDDAIAMGADAILVGVISEGGMSKKVQEGADKGIIQISMINPVYESPFTASVYCDSLTMGNVAGQVAVDYFGDKPEVRTVILPGPQGSGWAEKFSGGFQDVVKKTGRFIILDENFADTSKSVQLRLVEDSLQSYENIDLFFGNTPMCEVAINVLKEAGLAGKTNILAAYANEDIINGIKNNDIIGCVVEHCVAQARIAIDLAVRELEGKQFSGRGKILQVVPVGVTSANVATIDLSGTFAPASYKPVYVVN